MSQRTLRVNQLLLQEFSEELHTRWRQEAVRVTFTRFSISDDLRSAVLTYSVAGGDAEREAAKKLLRRVLNPLKAEVFKRVPIKYTPEIRLIYDESPAHGTRILDALDAVAREDAARDARTGKTAAANAADAEDADADDADENAADAELTAESGEAGVPVFPTAAGAANGDAVSDSAFTNALSESSPAPALAAPRTSAPAFP